MLIKKKLKSQDPQLVRQHIPLNKHESRLSYQKQSNKTTNVNKYQVGDWVLLRRNHGEYPKLNPIWEEMFQISKKIGTSCWGIVNFVSGKYKIVHHDQIQPAGTKQDASMVMGSSAPVQNPHAPVGRVLVDNSLPQDNIPQIDGNSLQIMFSTCQQVQCFPHQLHNCHHHLHQHNPQQPQPPDQGGWSGPQL